MKNTAHNLQSPFQEAELISTSSFVSYCQDNGVNISKEDLEILNKEALFYPAIKVYRGIVKFRKIYAKSLNGDGMEWQYVYPEDIKTFKPEKIDSKKYYSSGNFLLGRADWLDYYRKNKMVEYPAEQKFETWKTSPHLDYVTNSKLIEKDYEFFFDKIQLLSLKVALKERNFIVNFKGKEKTTFTKSAKKYLQEINHFAEVYFAIEDFTSHAYEVKRDRFVRYKKHGLNKKQVSEEWKEEMDFLTPEIKKAAQKLADKYSFNLEALDRWRRFLAWQNIFHESNRSSKCMRTYIGTMSEESLIHAEDANFMIHILNNFDFFLTGGEKTVKQVISNVQFPICPVCGRSFLSGRTNQKTCGNFECINENKNRSKRKPK